MTSTRPPSRKGLSRLELDVLAAIEEHSMLTAGQRVAVACSGGADSTALLHALLELGGRFGWVVSVAHFNHQLRGADSDADARFVRELAAAHSLAFHAASADVRTAARQSHANIEATARRLRYDFLRSLVAAGKADRIAVGHTADDQAETVLLRLLRGAGPQGLAAIRPTLPGGIIRPLIAVRAAAVRAWLGGRGIGWREDSSNQDLRLRRNLVRRKLLPALAEVNPAAVGMLAQTAALAQADEAFWQHYVRHLAGKHLRLQGNRASIALPALRRVHPAAALRLLKYTLELLADGGGSGAKSSPAPASTAARFGHIRSLHAWAVASHARAAKSWPRRPALALPGNFEARRDGKHLTLFRIAERSASRHSRAGDRGTERGYRLVVTEPGEFAIPRAGLTCRVEFIATGQNGAAYNGEGQALLDSSSLEFPLVLRNWQPGDAYRPRGRHKSRKLKELFSRHRVPIQMRASWPVLESGGRIVWSRRFGPAEELAARQEAREALLVTVCEDAASNNQPPE